MPVGGVFFRHQRGQGVKRKLFVFDGIEQLSQLSRQIGCLSQRRFAVAEITRAGGDQTYEQQGAFGRRNCRRKHGGAGSGFGKKYFILVGIRQRHNPRQNRRIHAVETDKGIAQFPAGATVWQQNQHIGQLKPAVGGGQFPCQSVNRTATGGNIANVWCQIVNPGYLNSLINFSSARRR